MNNEDRNTAAAQAAKAHAYLMSRTVQAAAA